MDKEENVNKKKGIRNLKICSGILALTTAITLMSLSCGKNKDGEQSAITTVVEEITSIPEETTVSTTTVEQVSTTTPKVTTVKETTSEVTTTQEEVTTPSTTTKEETTKEITKAPEETTSKTTTIKKEETTKKTTTTEDNSQIEEVLKLTKNNINEDGVFEKYFDTFLTHNFHCSSYPGIYDEKTGEWTVNAFNSGCDSCSLWIALENIDYIDKTTLNRLFGDLSDDQIYGRVANIPSVIGYDFRIECNWDICGSVINKKNETFLLDILNATIERDEKKALELCADGFYKENLATRLYVITITNEIHFGEVSLTTYEDLAQLRLEATNMILTKMGREALTGNPFESTTKTLS